MRTFKLIGALVLVLVSSAIAVASASAAELLWTLLPGTKGETFTGKSGKATLEGATVSKNKITCPSSTILLTFEGNSSELTEPSLALALIHFEKCKALGTLPVNSLGDGKEIILAHLEIHFCMIKPGDFGLLIKTLPVHLEIAVPALLISVEGAFIALVSPLTGDKKHFEALIEQEKGKQKIEKCEGGTAQTLTSKTDNEPVENAGEEAKEGLLLFDGTIDKAGEEMMDP